MLALLSLALCAQGLPLEVTNPTIHPLTNHPVSFGIPIPELLGFTDPEAHWFAVKDATGQAVPRQFRVLSRWHGERHEPNKPIKWVLVSFLANCPPGTTVNYYLSNGFSPSGSISVADFPDRAVISPTPGTTITINKQNFSLFESVVVDGQTVVAYPGGGLRMRDSNSVPVVPVVTETVFEEWGAVRLVVRQRGTLNNLAFTARYTFSSGQ
jgi:hypothetical protein